MEMNDFHGMPIASEAEIVDALLDGFAAALVACQQKAQWIQADPDNNSVVLKNVAVNFWYITRAIVSTVEDTLGLGIPDDFTDYVIARAAKISKKKEELNDNRNPIL